MAWPHAFYRSNRAGRERQHRTIVSNYIPCQRLTQASKSDYPDYGHLYAGPPGETAYVAGGAYRFDICQAR